MTAILPEDFEQDTIDAMMTGDGGYTVPWAMWVDDKRQCWLHPKYTIQAHTGGTVQMRVERRDDGYHVWLVPGEKYTPSVEHGYVSPRDLEFIPVVEAHR
jgi:hypothetical protein